MKFIAMFWPVWLVLMVAGYGYMLYHHLLPDKTSWAVAALSDDHRKKQDVLCRNMRPSWYDIASNSDHHPHHRLRALRLLFLVQLSTDSRQLHRLESFIIS